MTEPIPRKNCPACGATACFDETCSPEVCARADAFAALAPVGFMRRYDGIPPTSQWADELKRWCRRRSATNGVKYTERFQNVIHAAVRKYPRLRYAFAAADFAGWPELDAAFRLGGYEAMLDVAATMISEPKS